MASKKDFDEVINEKLAAGEDRVVISISFKITDAFEIKLLKHLWRFNHSQFIKRLLQRDIEGGAAHPAAAIHEPAIKMANGALSEEDKNAMAGFI